MSDRCETVAQFYDELSPYYHLVYTDWQRSICAEAEVLDRIIRSQCPGARRVLDVACGIGTQALGLAQLGYELTASDISGESVDRAGKEAAQRGLKIAVSVCDMRQASQHHRTSFDAVIACDNAVPHLLTDPEILSAFRECHACTRPGGVFVISVRDYDKEQRSGVQFKPHGVRQVGGVRYIVFQVWEFSGSIYETSMYIVEDDGASPKSRVMRTSYYAIGIGQLLELMRQAGFQDVQRIEGDFIQPILIGKRG
jgi:SAM-dependent methyltransferase